jgi:hypothetical protein
MHQLDEAKVLRAQEVLAIEKEIRQTFAAHHDPQDAIEAEGLSLSSLPTWKSG